jgi:hypothetical protein
VARQPHGRQAPAGSCYLDAAQHLPLPKTQKGPQLDRVRRRALKELPQISLDDALELTVLIARKDPRRHPRVAARWLLRYLEECDEATSTRLRWSPPVSPP